MRLGQRYSAARLDAVCARALTVDAISYRSVKSILEAGLDRQPLAGPEVGRALDPHANVHGAAYYAGGIDLANGRGGEPMQANRPDGTTDQASHMPQERLRGCGEASGSASGQASLSDDVATNNTALTIER
jgi:hypothetical protein